MDMSLLHALIFDIGEYGDYYVYDDESDHPERS